MEPQQTPSQNPLPNMPSMTPPPGGGSGSDWQRQAVEMARSSVNNAEKPGVAPPAVPFEQQAVQAQEQIPAGPQYQVAPQPSPMPQAGADVLTPPAPAAPPQPAMPQDNPPAWPQPAGAVISSDFGLPANPTPVSGSGGSSKGKVFLIIGGIVVVLALAVVAYFMFFAGGNKDAVNRAAEESNKTADADDVDLSAFTTVAFTAPTLPGYTKSETSTSTYQVYKNADGSCELGFGTFTAEQGAADLESLVDQAVTLLRTNDITVSDPVAGTALVLKDAKDSSKTYKMPTLVFELQRDARHGTTHYSGVRLETGGWAVVNRECAQDTGEPVADATIKTVDDLVKGLKITAQ